MHCNQFFVRQEVPVFVVCFFFFSSRRRHTRLQGDWSQTCALPIWIRRASLAKAVAIQIRTYSKSGSSHSTMTGRRRQFSGGVRSSSSGISTVGTLKIRISPPKNWRRRRNPHSKTLRTDVLARPLPPLPNRLQARGADAAVTADDRHIEINRSGRHDAVRHAAHATKREGFRGVFCISPLT